MAGDRRRSDVDRDPVRLLVVAGPDRGQRPAFVDGDGHRVPARRRVPAGGRGRRARSESRSVSPHSRSSASYRRTRSPEGEARSGAVDLDVVEPHDRIDLEGRGRRGPCARPGGGPGSPGGTSIRQSPGSWPCSRAGDPRPDGLSVRYSASTSPAGDRLLGRGRDPVLRERPHSRRRDLAAAADAASAADRIDVDAERPGRIEDAWSPPARGRAGPTA